MCVGMGEGELDCSGCACACACATYLSTDPPTYELPLKLAAVRFELVAEPALLLVTDRQAETQSHTHTHTTTHTHRHTHMHNITYIFTKQYIVNMSAYLPVSERSPSDSCRFVDADARGKVGNERPLNEPAHDNESSS